MRADLGWSLVRLGSAFAAPALLLAGCSNPPQELAVRFSSAPGTTSPDPAQVAMARVACPGSDTVRLQPESASSLASVRRVPLRYDVTGSTDRDVALVEGCLQRQPGVEALYLQRRTG